MIGGPIGGSMAQASPTWPAGWTVPPRRGAIIRNAPEGIEEGEQCMRGLCLARLELRPGGDWGGCTCWRSAPCGSCMSRAPECPRGCWRDESLPGE